VIPANGVYACYVLIAERKLKGMLNIGNRPTVNGTEKRVEVNIFDMDEELYGKEVTLMLQERIRDEKRFDSVDSLKARLAVDKNLALRIL
jgi:riboflavin kinase/FMN adenylyltransferase